MNEERSEFRRDVQGLRALAVALVVVFHGGAAWLPGGYVGVDVFFVISGFLITGQLVGRLERGRLGLADFYARRARRILPASLAVALVTLVASVLVVPPLQARVVVQDAVATALYVPNLLFGVRGTDYLAETTPSVFQHYWSLGVEEQFYVVWPLLLAGLFLLRSRRRVICAAAVVMIASFGAGWWATTHNPPLGFFLPFFRAWELGIGAVIALLPAAFWSRIAQRRVLVTGFVVAECAGLVAIIVAACRYDATTAFPGTAALVPTLGAAAVVAGGRVAPASWAARLLGLAPLVWIGTLSYAIYLVHWPLLVVPQSAVGWDQPLTGPVRAALAVASIPLGWLLWRAVEEPVRRARSLASPPHRVLVLAGVGPAVLASIAFVIGAVGVGSLAGSGKAPAFVPQLHPAGSEKVPANLRPSLARADRDNPVIYANGCHLSQTAVTADGCRVGRSATAPLVVLFGDSHAANWYPPLAALARQGRIRLESHTKSSCASAWLPFNAASTINCEEWRSAVMARIDSERPALVLLGNFVGDLVTVSDPASQKGWQDAVSGTVRRLPAGTRAALLVDTPRFDATPSICLSAHLGDATACAEPRARVLPADRTAFEHRVAAALGIAAIDLNDYLCGQTCPVVIDNTLLYRDPHHLTATFSRALARPLEAALEAVLRPGR